MNFVDIIVVSIIAIYALIGFWKGFIPQLFEFAGIFCAFYFNTPVSKLIANKFSEEPEGAILLLTQVAAFLLIYAAFFIAGKIVSKTADIVLTSLPNRIAGIVFGSLNGFFIVSVLFLMIRSLGNGDDFLKKYVTPDATTDEIINKSLDIASETLSDKDNKEKIESFKKEMPENDSFNDDDNKVYSRLGYGAYRISTMMDPFVHNMKALFKKKYDEIIESKVQEKINDYKEEHDLDN